MSMQSSLLSSSRPYVMCIKEHCCNFSYRVAICCTLLWAWEHVTDSNVKKNLLSFLRALRALSWIRGTHVPFVDERTARGGLYG